jgi:hypothetical protein
VARVDRAIEFPFIPARNVTLHAPRGILGGIAMKSETPLLRFRPCVRFSRFVEVRVRLPGAMACLTTHHLRMPGLQSRMNSLLKLPIFRVVADPTVLGADVVTPGAIRSSSGHRRRFRRGRSCLGECPSAHYGEHYNAEESGVSQPHGYRGWVLAILRFFISLIRFAGTMTSLRFTFRRIAALDGASRNFPDPVRTPNRHPKTFLAYNQNEVPLITSVWRVVRLLATLAGVALITWVGISIVPVNATAIGFEYLLLILVVATGWGFLGAFLASLVATLTFNFYFLPPVGRLTISDPQNVVALFSFLTTSIIASRLSTRAKRRALEALARQQDPGLHDGADESGRDAR